MGGKKKRSKTSKDVEPVEDERFAMAKPQFRAFSSSKSKSKQNQNNGGGLLTTSSNKVVLDERFASVLTDARFQLEEKDKYGRKKKKRKGSKKNSEMDAFYTIENDDKDGEDKEEKENNDKDDDASSSSSDDSSANDDKNKHDDKDNDPTEDPASRISYLTALSRGELDVSSSSSDDDSDSDESSDNNNDDDSSLEGEDPIHGAAGILDPSTNDEDQVEITHEQSPFLAVTNLDWNHMRAVDIFAILSSFSPPGTLQRVQVFLSDYGKEKIQLESQQGPPSLWKKKNKKTKATKAANDGADQQSSSHDDDDDGEDDNQSNTQEDDDEDSELDEQEPIADSYEEFIRIANEQNQQSESDFDPEKLRAYEASKLKYYFAVATFANAEAADVAYKEVDGMEFEHSSAAVDMRSIPKDEIDNVTRERELRDEATSIPGNYVPPAFIVSALQQTTVQCTWEAGDSNRERLLTRYNSAEQWAACAENDDLKAYLASDGSSDGEDDSDNDSDAPPNRKGARLRKLLGLDNDSGDEAEHDVGSGRADASDSESDDNDDTAGEQEVSKEIKYDPNKTDLQEKIRAKLEAKEDAQQAELTPWEKYKQKRKEKRKERKALRRKRSDIEAEEHAAKGRGGKSKTKGDGDEDGNKPTKEELELLLAGDNDEEVNKDFDMRGLQRIDKNKDKKLRGSRKRKEEKLAAGVSGKDFEINLKDSRFAAVLDGDDGRFGIDRTDPQYKETPIMREILEEQKARRKKRRTTKSTEKPRQKKSIPKDVAAGSNMKSSGSAALSSLVKSLKTKVTK